MLKILAIDTLDRSIVGVVEAGTTLEEIACERSAGAHRHVENLAPMVEEVAEGHRPDMIVVETGPAAFTDLRAGLAAAHAPSRAWDVPFYRVSPLEALTPGGAMRGLDGILATVNTGRRGLFVLRTHPLGPDDAAAVSGPEIAVHADLHAGSETAIVTSNPDLCSGFDGIVAVECRPEYLVRRALVLPARKEVGEDARLDAESWYLCRPDIHGT